MSEGLSLPLSLPTDEQINAVPRSRIPDAIGQLERLKTMLQARLVPAPSVQRPAADDDDLLDDRAVGVILGVAPGCVADLRRRGELPEVPVGEKYVRVRRADVRAYVFCQRDRRLAHRTLRHV